MFWTIVGALIAGCIIGPLARLVLPGKQNISVPMTIGIGAVGSLLGSLIYNWLSGSDGTGGIDWIALLIGVAVAAVLILVYGAVAGKPQTR